MERVEYKDGFIRTRRAALIALCVTGYIAALSFWSLFSDAPHKTFWFVGPGLLPSWIVVPANVAFYAYLLWVGVALYRITNGKELILIVGYFTDIVLGPIQNLVSASAVNAIQYVKAFGMTAAFLAALCIFIERVSDDVRGKSVEDSS
jgi:hypothetical protein